MMKQLLKIGLSLFAIVIFISMGLAQQRPIDGEPVILTGKIGHMDRIGSYYVKGETPPAMVIIVNQDPKLLEELRASGKTVTVEGRLTLGADLLFVEKIDGKPYMGSRVNN
jgi:hypothetical protein